MSNENDYSGGHSNPRAAPQQETWAFEHGRRARLEEDWKRQADRRAQRHELVGTRPEALVARAFPALF